MKTVILLCLLLGFVLSAGAQPRAVRADDGSQIDVLVLYTQNARAIAGGTHPQAVAMIGAAIAGVNADFAANGVLTQLNIVLLQPVFYLEQVNIDFHADLNNLTGTTDGYLDEIHALRDYFAADLVLLVAGTWFYIYTGDSALAGAPDPAQGFVVWESRGLDDGGGAFNAQWFARTMGVDAAPPFEPAEVALLNANRVAVANYRDSADRIDTPLQLALNGSFEVDMDGDRVPDFWASTGWESGDRLQCANPLHVRGGSCSVKLKVSAGDSDGLVQPANGGLISLGDIVTFSGYAKSSGEGTCVVTTLILKFETLPKARQTDETCLASAEGWTLAVSQLTVADIVTMVKAKVRAVGSGKVWLDDFSVAAGASDARGGGR